MSLFSMMNMLNDDDMQDKLQEVILMAERVREINQKLDRVLAAVNAFSRGNI